jgi:uncharacterized repeat protein (TIGR01451 family)
MMMSLSRALVKGCELSPTDSGTTPSPARRAAPLTYTIAVTNTGPDQATSVQLIDTLPLSTTFAAASPSQGSCLGTATIVCNLGALASGAPATVTLVVTPTAAGLFTNRIAVNATSFDPVLANNTASETTAVAPQADLAVSQRDSPDPVRPGAPLTYTLAVTNAGPDPAIAVVLTDTLPLSAVLETAAPSQGSCIGAVIVTCNLGSIASGDHVTLTVAVTPTAAGLMTNLANVTATDFDPALANNSDNETTTVVALWRLYLPLVRS